MHNDEECKNNLPESIFRRDLSKVFQQSFILEWRKKLTRTKFQVGKKTRSVLELSSGQSVASVTTRVGVGVGNIVNVGADNSPRFYSRALHDNTTKTTTTARERKIMLGKSYFLKSCEVFWMRVYIA